MRVDARRNRERLLEAARDVVVEQGVDAPLEDIARRAGVGIATLYRRFPDRTALLRAVAVHVLEAIGAEARAALAEETDPFAALSRYLRRSLELRIAAVMPVLDGRLDLGADEEIRRARDGVTPHYVQLVAAAHASGQLRADVGAGDIGLLLIRLARPLPGSFPRDLDAAAASRQLDLMLDGLRTPPPTSPQPPLTLPALLRRL
jgi:AcrR family transcriptional regulator